MQKVKIAKTFTIINLIFSIISTIALILIGALILVFTLGEFEPLTSDECISLFCVYFDLVSLSSVLISVVAAFFSSLVTLILSIIAFVLTSRIQTRKDAIVATVFCFLCFAFGELIALVPAILLCISIDKEFNENNRIY